MLIILVISLLCQSSSGHKAGQKEEYKDGSESWYKDLVCADNRTVILELYGWHYSDLARECEDHLGPAGFCAVQVLPVNELKEASGLK